MVFKRVWDSSCPLLWDKWVADEIVWTIEDLLPEDDEHALQLLIEQFCPDERLISTLGMHEDPDALQKMGDFWRDCLSQRMSLACYKTVKKNRSLVALNVCVVKCIDDKDKTGDIGKGKFADLLNTLTYLDRNYDAFKDLGVDKFLYGLGLLVTRENRGQKLGSKLLAARLPMCQKFGLTATSTLFTGDASQKTAALCGFKTDFEVTLGKLAENGLPYPKGDERAIKIMSKKYH
ncbi:uncharacterized protein LOC125241874 [Leguminivora glycinivorella]|uniref:uncharacterized protein LOC125241874 n=1 Tax=Leguminivora glycinivorella TaxID=1035111 RepID=UPI00200F6F6F|nr:uncharacterized protein LOC125241874 [Leguminivora glycinivorella]